MKKHKICIAGGGLTGLIVARILSNEEVDIDFIFGKQKRTNSVDLRATAISESNFHFLKSQIKDLDLSLFNSINKIILFFENKGKIANFLNLKQKKDLIIFFENRKFKSHLLKKLAKTNVQIIKKSLEKVNVVKDEVISKNFSKTYDLIILCLGAETAIYEDIIGKRGIQKDYSEYSITGSVSHDIKDLTAQQFFLDEGPLAILPYKKNFFSFVWSVEKKYFLKNEKRINLLVKEKLSSLLGNKKIIIKQSQKYPLKMSMKKNYYKKNTIILGEGIHTVHPIAGQGFNLVLRDIQKLTELISRNIRLGLPIKNYNKILP